MTCGHWPWVFFIWGAEMAKKYLQILSTRSTAIGTLRFGVIYTLDDTDPRVGKVIKALTNNGTKAAPKRPAGKLLTESEVDFAKAEVQSLIPPEDATASDGEDFSDVLSELGERARSAEDKVTLLEGELGKSGEDVIRLNGELKAQGKLQIAVDARVKQLEGDLKLAGEEHDVTRGELAAKVTALEISTEEIQRLNARVLELESKDK
jgi:hypothetical protein